MENPLPPPCIVRAGAPLPPSSLSIVSYNVMMPNEHDGWWMYKMYKPRLDRTPSAHSAWPMRQALLRARIASASADVVCIQEACGATEDAAGLDDFAFMRELGYEGRAVAGRGRMRCATFWRTSRVVLIGEPVSVHRDLIARFEVRRSAEDDAVAPAGRTQTNSSVWVINCHLPAGHQAARQLQSLHKMTEKVRKLSKAPEHTRGDECASGAAAVAPRVVIVGDFNSDASPSIGAAASSLDLFLRQGACPKGFVDPATAALLCRKKPKKQPFGAFLDAYEECFCSSKEAGSPPPPSVVYPHLYARFLEPSASSSRTEEEPSVSTMSAALVASLTRMFARYGGGEGRLSRSGVEAWDAVTRVGAPAPKGAASAIMDRKRAEGQAEELTLSEFLRIYQSCLDDGKPWEVAHDVWATGDEAGCLPPIDELPAALGAPYCARFDRIWHNAGLRTVAVLRPRTEDEAVANEPLPNAWSPSDHLMLGASFALE